MSAGEVDLLPCPFCGSEHPQWVGSSDGDYVECGSCLAMMRPHDPEVPDEVARWNTRLAPVEMVTITRAEYDELRSRMRWAGGQSPLVVKSSGAVSRPTYAPEPDTVVANDRLLRDLDAAQPSKGE